MVLIDIEDEVELVRLCPGNLTRVCLSRPGPAGAHLGCALLCSPGDQKMVSSQISNEHLLQGWKGSLPPIHVNVPLFRVQLHKEAATFVGALNAELELLASCTILMTPIFI